MKFRFLGLLAGLVVAVSPAAALTIDKINVSTVFGYGDSYQPAPYPSYNRFSILGAALSYQLSNGELRSFGAGWIPYTNGNLASVSVSEGVVSYTFDRVHNWAKGEGTIFYSVGQVLCQDCTEAGAGRWTEGAFEPVSAIVIQAELGSTTATLSGTARIAMNNDSGNWGRPEDFLAFSAPEGAIVNYVATYTLTDGSVWAADTFDKSFSYNVFGSIALTPVPEASSMLMLSLGLGMLTLIQRRRLPSRA